MPSQPWAVGWGWLVARSLGRKQSASRARELCVMAKRTSVRGVYSPDKIDLLPQG